VVVPCDEPGGQRFSVEAPGLASGAGNMLLRYSPDSAAGLVVVFADVGYSLALAKDAIQNDDYLVVPAFWRFEEAGRHL
jgi:hypothetical protein